MARSKSRSSKSTAGKRKVQAPSAQARQAQDTNSREQEPALDPAALNMNPAQLIKLQRTLGNRSVLRMMAKDNGNKHRQAEAVVPMQVTGAKPIGQIQRELAQVALSTMPSVQREGGHEGQIKKARDAADAAEAVAILALEAASKAADSGDLTEITALEARAHQASLDRAKHLTAVQEAMAARKKTDTPAGLRVEAEEQRFFAAQHAADFALLLIEAMRAKQEGDDDTAQEKYELAESLVAETESAHFKAQQTFADDEASVHRSAAAGKIVFLVQQVDDLFAKEKARQSQEDQPDPGVGPSPQPGQKEKSAKQTEQEADEQEAASDMDDEVASMLAMVEEHADEATWSKLEEQVKQYEEASTKKAAKTTRRAEIHHELHRYSPYAHRSGMKFAAMKIKALKGGMDKMAADIAVYNERMENQLRDLELARATRMLEGVQGPARQDYGLSVSDPRVKAPAERKYDQQSTMDEIEEGIAIAEFTLARNKEKLQLIQKWKDEAKSMDKAEKGKKKRSKMIKQARKLAKEFELQVYDEHKPDRERLGQDLKKMARLYSRLYQAEGKTKELDEQRGALTMAIRHFEREKASATTTPAQLQSYDQRLVQLQQQLEAIKEKQANLLKIAAVRQAAKGMLKETAAAYEEAAKPREAELGGQKKEIEKKLKPLQSQATEVEKKVAKAFSDVERLRSSFLAKYGEVLTPVDQTLDMGAVNRKLINLHPDDDQARDETKKAIIQEYAAFNSARVDAAKHKRELDDLQRQTKSLEEQLQVTEEEMAQIRTTKKLGKKTRAINAAVHSSRLSYDWLLKQVGDMGKPDSPTGEVKFNFKVGVAVGYGLAPEAETEVAEGGLYIEYTGKLWVEDDARARVSHSVTFSAEGSAKLGEIAKAEGALAYTFTPRINVYESVEHWAAHTAAYLTKAAQMAKLRGLKDSTTNLANNTELVKQLFGKKYEALGPKEREMLQYMEKAPMHVKAHTFAMSGGVKADLSGGAPSPYDLSAGGSAEAALHWWKFQREREGKKETLWANRQTLSASVGVPGASFDVTFTRIGKHANPNNDGQYLNIKVNYKGPFYNLMLAPAEAVSQARTKDAHQWAEEIEGRISELDNKEPRNVLNTVVGLLGDGALPETGVSGLDIFQGTGASMVSGLEFNFVKPEGLLPNYKLQYMRMNRSASVSFSAGIPIVSIPTEGGEVHIKLKLSAGLGKSGSYGEIIGTNTLTYVQTRYDGYLNQTVNREKGMREWLDWTVLHRIELWELFRRIATKESSNARKETLGAPGHTAFLHAAETVFENDKKKPFKAAEFMMLRNLLTEFMRVKNEADKGARALDWKSVDMSEKLKLGKAADMGTMEIEVDRLSKALSLPEDYQKLRKGQSLTKGVPPRHVRARPELLLINKSPKLSDHASYRIWSQMLDDQGTIPLGAAKSLDKFAAHGVDLRLKVKDMGLEVVPSDDLESDFINLVWRQLETQLPEEWLRDGQYSATMIENLASVFEHLMTRPMQFNLPKPGKHKAK